MRSSRLWPLAFGLALVAAMSATGFVLYRRAAKVVEAELDARLVGLARASAAIAQRGDASAPARLALLRDATGLENAFVMDDHQVSVADARPGVVAGQRYTWLDFDPDAAAKARAGADAVSDTIVVEGVPLKSAYAPAGNGRIAVVVASPTYVKPLSDLARLPWLALAFGLVAAGVFGVAFVAARHRLEETAQASLRMERLALAGRLAAQVAHEIRNPLAIVRGSVQLAGRALATGGDAAGQLAQVVEEVDRINALVEDFLSLSRDVALKRARCDLNAVAERVASLVEAGAGRRVVRESSPGELVVDADERRLRQALLALLMNAFEASADARVELRTGNGAQGPWVEVVDDGPGMAPQLLARAGEPFFTTKPSGTGLGLPVVRQIAEAHGARLLIQSAVGVGTTARVQFVRADDDEVMT